MLKHSSVVITLSPFFQRPRSPIPDLRPPSGPVTAKSGIDAPRAVFARADSILQFTCAAPDYDGNLLVCLQRAEGYPANSSGFLLTDPGAVPRMHAARV